jgi:hypothetical protein
MDQWFWDRIQADPVVASALAALLVWFLAAWAYFKGSYGAEKFRLKAERSKILKALAYLGALPVRLLLAVFSGAVTTLLVATLALIAWALYRALHG